MRSQHVFGSPLPVYYLLKWSCVPAAYRFFDFKHFDHTPFEWSQLMYPLGYSTGQLVLFIWRAVSNPHIYFFNNAVACLGL